MLKRLVLFDIDGTLLWPDRAGRDAMSASLERVYGTAGSIDGFRFKGRTDRAIVHALMRAAGLPEETITARFGQIRTVMVEEMNRRLEAGLHDVRPCPGAHALVASLASRDDVLLGLLTGNFKETAHIKLGAAGFDPASFRLGAYGDESESRADLPPLAVGRAADLTGVHFQSKQIVIIGDTADDVTCGRGVGARSIAVMTGWSERAEIEDAFPDYLFNDLVDTQAVLKAILSPA